MPCNLENQLQFVGKAVFSAGHTLVFAMRTLLRFVFACEVDTFANCVCNVDIFANCVCNVDIFANCVCNVDTVANCVCNVGTFANIIR